VPLIVDLRPAVDVAIAAALCRLLKRRRRIRDVKVPFGAIFNDRQSIGVIVHLLKASANSSIVA
jgi:hypothetical protein